KERGSAHCARHCAAGSDGEDELRRHVARRAKGCVIEGCQILFHSSACRLRVTVLVPIFAGDRALLVGVGGDQARIDRKALPTDTLSRNRSLRARENAEWSGIGSSILKPQNQRYAKLTLTSRHSSRSERMPNT